MAIVIIVKTESGKEKLRLTAKATTIGRSSKADFKISDENLSSIHASFELTHDHNVLVKDLGSTNGTFLNGSQIQESHIYVDDEILIGTNIFYISKGELTQKEAKQLTRDFERTNMSFVKLNDKMSPKEATKSVSRVSTKLAESQGKEVSKKASDSNINETVSRVKEKLENQNFAGDDENLVDMEESSGNTQFIKIGKAPAKKTKAKAKKAKARKKKSRKAKKESTGLFGKIKKLFGD
ncbi:MAG: FHA domain-containing protein [Oligoflexia bacterium]|nr:FHA domain-containing protein [Oligoflexia bacterium]